MGRKVIYSISGVIFGIACGLLFGHVIWPALSSAAQAQCYIGDGEGSCSANGVNLVLLSIALYPLLMIFGGIVAGVGGNFLARYINKREEKKKLTDKPQ